METSQVKDKKQQEPGKPRAAAGSKKSTVIRKIKGQIMKKRTTHHAPSGDTASPLLQASGSFDLATSGVTRSRSWGNNIKGDHHHRHLSDYSDENSSIRPSSSRSRANTAPCNLESSTVVLQQSLVDSNDGGTASDYMANTENPTPVVTTMPLSDDNKESLVVDAGDNRKVKNNATITSTTTILDDLVISTTGLSDAITPYHSQDDDDDDDDDEDDDAEIRLAKAMAQAIQANPNMTPEEIHKLIGKTTTVLSNQQQQQQLFDPSRISSLFTTGSLMATTVVNSSSMSTIMGGGGAGGGGGEIKPSSSSISSDGGGGGKSKSKRSFRFDKSRLERAARGILTGGSTRNMTATTTTTTAAVSSTNNNTNHASIAAAAAMSSSSDSFVEQGYNSASTLNTGGDGTNNNNYNHVLSEVSSVASAGSGGGGGLRLSFRQSKSTPLRSPPVSPGVVTARSTTTIMANTANAVAATTMPSSISSNSNNNANGNGGGGNIKPVLTAAASTTTNATTASTAVRPKATTTTTSRSMDENEIAQQQQPVIAIAEIPPGGGGSASLDVPIVVCTTMSAGPQSTMLVQTSMAAAPASTTSTAAHTTASALPSAVKTRPEKPPVKTMPEKATTAAVSFIANSKPAVSPTNAVSSGPIRLSGLAWKRRGGMGKYSSSGAWERRRIELQGSRLLYYQEETTLGSSPTELAAAAGLEEIDEGLLVQKRTTWLEQAWTTAAATTAAAALAAGATTVTVADDPTAPRGYMDLTKDKATVQASWGHSGAPSPFAISIKKPGGETKWKLCFDYHKDQMEWLAALTDVVVQNSVDSYNQLLLEAADPSNQYTITDSSPATTVAAAAAAAILHPIQSVASPPGTLKTAHQLWTMGVYCIGYPPNLDLVEAAKHVASTKTTDTTNEHNGECDETESPLEENDAETEIGIDTTTKSIAVDQDGEVGNVIDEDIVDEDIDAVAQAAATDAAVKTRVLPEQNMALAVAVLNVALAFCRSSATSMERFWYVVALANVTMFLLTIQQPDWKSVVHYVRGARCCSNEPSSSSPLETSSTSLVATSTTKSTRTPSLRKSDKVAAPAARQASGSLHGKKKAPTGYLPLAGATAIKLVNTTDKPANSKGEMFAGWRCPPGDTLQVRSHGYSLTKKKVDSPGELYECVRVDVFESPARYPDMAKRVQLPKVEFKDEGPKTWRTPDIIVISIALPTDPPKMGRSSSDGGGYTITMYCAMKQETRDILRRVTADGYDHSMDDVANGGDPQKSKVNAVRLLEEWCRRAPTDPSWFSRFKVVPNAHNLKEIGMPSWISKYNGKPFLIKRPGVTGFLHQHPELSCLEFDISIHPFPYLAKQAICFMKESYFKRVLVTFGFVIEGKTDDELPECIIAAMQLCYPDPAFAIMADTFFAGTCHNSFD